MKIISNFAKKINEYMATESEKLASSLEVLRKLQQDGHTFVVCAKDISRTHLVRLVDNGFLEKVINGWYIPSEPTAQRGDTTAWYISYWTFVAQYLKDRLGNAWSLSPEQSLDILTGNCCVPRQLIVRSPQCNNSVVQLIHGCSIFLLKSNCAEEICVEQNYGLNVYGISEAIIMVAPTFFQREPVTARAALSAVKDSSDMLRFLLDSGKTVKAGRIIGAFRNVGMADMADEIKSVMSMSGHLVSEEDPFAEKLEVARNQSPYATRIMLMWHNMRETVLHCRPETNAAVGMDLYMKDVDERYKHDAYHSLSIEGYQVTEELIEKVKSGKWNPKTSKSDAKTRDALAARGYWQAFQVVKESIMSVLSGMNPGKVVETDHRKWYQEMFAPCVAAGIIKPIDVAGYRAGQVFIRHSMHTPLNSDAVRDTMPVLFEMLKQEEDAWVRAVLGHFVFTFIHPYYDGNGRIGRFLMNVMLASGGYRWTIVPADMRDVYMTALEKASLEGDIRDFAEFLATMVKKNLG